MPEMLIGGEWRQAAAHEELEVVNPATEETVDSVPAGKPEDIELAVATAKRAFGEWSRTDVEKRAAILTKAAELIRERAKELAATLTSEQGKPIAEAMGEVTHLAHGVHYYAEAATKVRGAYQDLPSTLGPAYGMVIRRPMGVCAAITPYNFPLTLLGTKVAPALASGNTVVAKPAATTPLATLEVAKLFAEAGVPDGVLNVVTGRGSGDRRRAGQPPRRQTHRVHRLDRGRTSRRHACRPRPQARNPRARRQRPRDHLRRRRRRCGGQGGDHRALLERRPGVPRVQARVRPRLGVRRVRLAARRAGRALRAGRRDRQGREAQAPHGSDPHATRAATSCSSRSRMAWRTVASC